VTNAANQRTRIAAYGLIVRNDEILLCRLSDKVPNAAGKWTLPGGGVEFGEHPEEAMMRELLEETGLVVRPEGLAGIDSRVIRNGDIAHHNIRVLYFASVITGALRHEIDGSTDECKWWPRTELPTLVSVATKGVELAFAEEAS
jgi:ADP-ribose pyrophosphatase YjhB (NUDIX family)